MIAATTLTRPATAARPGCDCNPARTEPAAPAVAVPAIAPSTTPIVPRGTSGLVRGAGSTTSVSLATTRPTVTADRQTTIDWVPNGCRSKTSSEAKATTPTTTASVAPSDS